MQNTKTVTLDYIFFELRAFENLKILSYVLCCHFEEGGLSVN